MDRHSYTPMYGGTAAMGGSSASRSPCCRISCKGCITRTPYGTITATLLALLGIAIGFTSLFYATSITERMSLDLFHKKLLWLNDVKVAYVVAAALLGVLVIVNLVIGFATTGQGEPTRPRSKGCCNKSATATCLIRVIFLLNYILLLVLFITSLISLVSLFGIYVMSTLCNEGSRIVARPDPALGDPTPEHRPGEMPNYIDLQQFAPLIAFQSNETYMLRFEGPRLKQLCVDYVSGLFLYIIMVGVGFFLVWFSFLNYIINLTANLARTTTRQKLSEIIFLNAAEMTAFGGDGMALETRY